MTVSDLAREVELRDIRTMGTLARVGRGPQPAAGESVDTRVSLRVGFTRTDEHHFDVFVWVDCRPRRQPDEPAYARFVFEAVARYGAVTRWPDETLDGFMRTNAMVHLWPYARQYVQTACAQLGLPPLVLPPFRVTPAR